MKKPLKPATPEEITADLWVQFPAAEAKELQLFAEKISREVARPHRSAEAKQAGWDVLRGSIHAEQPKKWFFSWKLALVPAMLLVLLAGMTWVSQTAVPGDATYSFKRTTENIQLRFATTNQKKADMCSMLMKRRANELALLPDAAASTKTVVGLTTAIEEEANEYEEYARTPGTKNADLTGQRVRDAHYVISALKTAQTKQLDAASQKAIASTIASMNEIVSES